MEKIIKDGISYSGSTYTGGTNIEITGAREESNGYFNAK